MQIHTNDTNKESKIIHRDLSYQITGLCFKVHNKLGRFCSERQYSDALEQFLIDHQISYKREYDLKELGKEIEGNRVDFLIKDAILLDAKAKKIVTKEDYYQMMRYLQCTGLRLGLIVNFRNTYLKPKRILNHS